MIICHQQHGAGGGVGLEMSSYYFCNKKMAVERTSYRFISVILIH